MRDEQSDVELRVADIYGTAGLERLREEQREKLLPQLERKRERLTRKKDELLQELLLIDDAIGTIEASGITDYQIRKPREEQAPEPEQEDES